MEKRHMSHRVGGMLHHRFPNGFTELFMDETDHEVSTLTDRAFRSLCIGDDAVYNDEFSYGYSPFSCRKPLVEEPHKKAHHKESKKQGHHRGHNSINDAQPWKEQQKNISQVSSFLKALSVTEKSCEGLLIKNGDAKDPNGESWDKSALRSIQRELSEFSSDYHDSLTDGDFSRNNRHPSIDKSAKKNGKDSSSLSGKSSKIKNGKSAIKLRKLNIKNFFLHSEFSPFQTWTDFKRFPYGQEEIVTSVPTDNISKWYDSPLYKELAEAHRIDSLHSETEESQSGQKVIEPPPPLAPKHIHLPPPCKVLPKLTATPAEKRCSSDGGEGNAAPWRRARSRAKSVVPVSQPAVISALKDHGSKPTEDSLVAVQNEAKSLEVKAIEEVSSLASTPFSICQLMTPLIPSRQPTETSELLQSFCSPSSLNIPLRPDSGTKLTPELPIKRESYKSLASSILFNLKDNRKRVKSRYSPPKFKTSELPDRGTQSPRLDNGRHANTSSDGNTSGFSTPAIGKDGRTCSSPVLKQASTPALAPGKGEFDTPLSSDYLMLNVLQSKRDSAGSRCFGEENHYDPLMQLKKNKSPNASKLTYPSLNLYKKTCPVGDDISYLQVPQRAESPSSMNNCPLLEQSNKPLTDRDVQLSPNTEAVNIHWTLGNIVQSLSSTVPSPDSKEMSSLTLEKEGVSQNVSVKKGIRNGPDNPKSSMIEIKEKDLGQLTVGVKDKDLDAQPLSRMDIIKAAREAINAAKYKALSAGQSESIKKTVSESAERREKEKDECVNSIELTTNDEGASDIEINHFLLPESTEKTDETRTNIINHMKKEPPPVPMKNFAKSDIQLIFDKQKPSKDESLSKIDMPTAENNSPVPNESKFVKKQGRLKRVFSARQNNYIKSQRHTLTGDGQEEDHDESEAKGYEKMLQRETRDKEHIINDLHALKELEMARLGDRVLENARNKLVVVNIDKEAKAKNDLISRELRNIKRGMLSMRGNTMAKRDIFAKREQQQSKHEMFTKIDSNVIVNKTYINDNYDRAKMALEEIISERKKNKVKKEENGDLLLGENIDAEIYALNVKHDKVKHGSLMDAEESHNDNMLALREQELRERLGDLRDHSHMKCILSLTEAKPGESHRSGAKMELPGINAINTELNILLASKSKHRRDSHEKITDNIQQKNDMHTVKLMSVEMGDDPFNEKNGGNRKKTDAPPVPPRSKKWVMRGNEMNMKESESAEDVGEFTITESKYKTEVHSLRGKTAGSRSLEQESNIPTRDTGQIKNTKADPILPEWSILSEQQSQNIQLCLSPGEERVAESKAYSKETNSSTPRAITTDCNIVPQEKGKVKRKSPLRPNDLNIVEPLHQESTTNKDNTVTTSPFAKDTDKTRAVDEIMLDQESPSESVRNIISPMLLVNGLSVNQSPPDQASWSSKSSYFSAESALHRNTETDSNVYHSLENLTGESEEVDKEMRSISGNLKKYSEKTEMEYYSVSDHESEHEACKQTLNSPYADDRIPGKEIIEHAGEDTDKVISSQSLKVKEDGATLVFPSSTLSPTLGIPALFKVKDNTLCNKTVKPLKPWLQKENLNASQFGREELHLQKEDVGLASTNRTPVTNHSTSALIDSFLSKQLESLPSPNCPPSPSNVLSENLKKSQFDPLLTVPQEEDKNSGVSPSSEGVESLAADTGDEMVSSMAATTEDGQQVSKVPSERSGSTCSGNDSQTGLPKPPAVLPKSEKALLKAIKLTNRRIKKEEAQTQAKPSHMSSGSSRKHTPDKHKSDTSGHKPSEHRTSGGTRCSERRSKQPHRKEIEGRYPHEHPRHSKEKSQALEHYERRDSSASGHDPKRLDQPCYRTGRRIYERPESNSHSSDRLPCVSTEMEDGSNGRHIRDKDLENRRYNSDGVISDVPVYKVHVTERPFHPQRSQSIDRCSSDKGERRPSVNMSVSERLGPRSQRIEKTIMDELQQRGRARGRASGKYAAIKRSHSMDTCTNEISQPSNLSRQPSHTSQLSHQSSVDHAIVTQAFPMTQRKLLQDPDSGQYFFVDMPVQVKTKTFFDPETGSYVQLPVQPPEGAVPQTSAVEMLNTPLVLYHGFVPVPLSTIAHKSAIQASQMEQGEFEQKHLERSGQVYSQEKHPYLEPVYGQHDHVLGEFLGTEELDCVG